MWNRSFFAVVARIPLKVRAIFHKVVGMIGSVRTMWNPPAVGYSLTYPRSTSTYKSGPDLSYLHRHLMSQLHWRKKHNTIFSLISFINLSTVLVLLLDTLTNYDN